MKSIKQAFNPYLPSYEYVPDGEAHVFGDRLYLYGSHDRFNGAGFCLNDYVCWSADVNDLTEWRYEGVIFRKEQDPVNQNIPEDAPELPAIYGIYPEKPEDGNPKGMHAMWAPDTVCGPDGKYYLYYCMDFLPEIRVAVCDTPAGRYEYLGMVCHKDGTPLGQSEDDYIQFDPGVFIDTDGTIYLYSGNSPREDEVDDGRHRSQVMTLEEDMLTLREEPRQLLPALSESKGSGFEGHEFYEASSIRHIGDKYYFVYSSVNSHELCYCISDRPDGGYEFGGTIVDIGDIYLDGRTEAESVNALGNTHGGIECCNGQWYVFYHRQTNRSNFSRQSCAEKIFFDENGRIAQAEVTSCGLNYGALEGEGTYPANICCHLTSAEGAAFSLPYIMQMDYPFLTQDTGDIEPSAERMIYDREEPVQYICNMRDGSTAGYKYFDFKNTSVLCVEIRGNAEGVMQIRNSLSGEVIAEISVACRGNEWEEFSGNAPIPDGIHALYLTYRGTGSLDLRRIRIERLDQAELSQTETDHLEMDPTELSHLDPDPEEFSHLEMDLIDRVAFYERLFDEIRSAGDSHTADFDQKRRMLDEYYSSGQWREDYEADEQGKLPDDIKRGVLSQDALYDFLSETDDLDNDSNNDCNNV